MKKVPAEEKTRFSPAGEGALVLDLIAEETLPRSFGITGKTDKGDRQILKLSVTAGDDVIHNRSSDEAN